MKKRLAVLAVCTVLGLGMLPKAAPALPGDGEGNAQGAAGDNTAGLKYKVVEGDSLWNLAAKHLGSPWRWKEIWERNLFLTNPHYIYPGTVITIFPPAAKEYSMVEAPPPPPPPEPVMEEPEDEPEPAPLPVETKPAKKADAGPRVVDIKTDDLVRSGDFSWSRPKGVGYIRGGESRKAVFAEGDRVYLSMKKPVAPGQMLGVYRVRGPVSIPSAQPFSGYVRYLIGVLQVERTDGDVVKGMVRKSYEEMGREDIVTEEIPSGSPVAIVPGKAGLKSTVIAGREEKEQMGAGDVIFLDRGSKAGVAAGNVFRIYSRGDGRPGEADVPVETARAVVLRTSSTFSTAYVVYSVQGIEPGDMAVRGR